MLSYASHIKPLPNTCWFRYGTKCNYDQNEPPHKPQIKRTSNFACLPFSTEASTQLGGVDFGHHTLQIPHLLIPTLQAQSWTHWCSNAAPPPQGLGQDGTWRFTWYSVLAGWLPTAILVMPGRPIRVRSGTWGEVTSRLISSWLIPMPFPAMATWAREEEGKKQNRA